MSLNRFEGMDLHREREEAEAKKSEMGTHAREANFFDPEHSGEAFEFHTSINDCKERFKALDGSMDGDEWEILARDIEAVIVSNEMNTKLTPNDQEALENLRPLLSDARRNAAKYRRKAA